ncbi:arsenate reductase family protein [Oceanobacillus alkalisoli]|uniref:arsenate reductase family protein n=1 Tax=Oceanobacillus alkalisoli TaxID=2925113 RepID=UPI001EF155B2|nr:arsenate reductase family protein [Oceanobacillus alkalisoli]MCF3943229.1 arsenate reductase family protein [Oceanobacillus alkalisoli]MCG5103893.1 arsenate reductase family protein [Oceanobacillus alkalisoli]
MSITIYWYPKCGTCRNAKKWLEANNIDFEAVHIVEDTPSKEEILKLIEKSGLEPKKFFNTSGKKYRELNMKEKLKDATVEEMAEYLASDGMLIKRPIATNGDKVTVGFKEDEYEATWG